MRFRTAFVLFCILPLAAGCATGSSIEDEKSLLQKEGVHTRMFEASTISFNGASGPGIWEKEFLSKVEISVRAGIRSYRFSNFLVKKDEPSVVVVLAISGRTAGLAIYDGSGRRLAEYSRGKARNDSVFFDIKSKEGTAKIKWYLGLKTIVSIFESYSSDGRLGSSEVTYYKMKR